MKIALHSLISLGGIALVAYGIYQRGQAAGDTDMKKSANIKIGAGAAIVLFGNAVVYSVVKC